MITSWQQKRSDLNHYWLKNTFLRTRINTFISRLERPNQNKEHLTEFIGQDWPIWASKSEEIKELLNLAETSLSPRQLFDQPPLSLCGNETKSWLPDLVHNLWVARSSLQINIEQAKTALTEADRLHEKLTHLISDADTLDMELLQEQISLFREFETAAIWLSECIHLLPNKVLVV